MGTVAVGVAVVIGLLWLRDHDKRIRETASATRSMDSLRLAVTVERSERAAEHTRDSIASLRAIQASDALLARARRESDRLSGDLGRLLDSLGAILPDTLDPFAARILASYNELQRTFDRTLAAADSAIAVRDEWIVQIESTYASDLSKVDAQIDECMAQLVTANRRSNPGLLTRVARALPYLAGVYLVLSSF
jgi:hypothetical protein